MTRTSWFELEVAEGAARFVARRRQIVVVVAGSELDREHRAFGRGAADHEGDVVRRAGGRAEALHLVDEVGDELLRIEDSLGFLIEVGLVGRAAALDDAEELVFHAFRRFDVDLSGEVALGVDFFVHRERSVLRITQGFLGVRVVNALGDGFFVAEARPDVLALFTVDDGRARVLAEGEHALGGRFGVAQEREGDVLVVVARFGVVKDLRDLFVVRTAEHEVHVGEGAVDELGEAFGFNLEDGMSFEFGNRDVVLRNEDVFGFILSVLEHRSVLEGGILSHASSFFAGKKVRATQRGLVVDAVVVGRRGWVSWILQGARKRGPEKSQR